MTAQFFCGDGAPAAAELLNPEIMVDGSIKTRKAEKVITRRFTNVNITVQIFRNFWLL